MIKAQQTYYYCQLFDLNPFETDMHLIQYEILVSPGNRDVVHHLVFHECPHDFDLKENQTQAHECGATPFPEHFAKCLYSPIIAIWVTIFILKIFYGYLVYRF